MMCVEYTRLIISFVWVPVLMLTLLRQRCVLDRVSLVVMGTTGPEHERVHTHTHVSTFALDALPHEHASTTDTVHAARLRSYQVTWGTSPKNMLIN